MDTLLILLAALLAWGGARWSKSLYHYEMQRRSIPWRDGVTVILAIITSAIAVWQSQGLVSAAFMALWSVIFVLISIIDIETHFIPNIIIFPAIGSAFLAAYLVDPRLSFIVALFGALIGLIFMTILYLAAGILYPGGLGLGDVKLAIFIGAVTGMWAVLYSLVAGMALSGIILPLLLALRRISLKTYVPYGPYLCFGGWLGMLPAVRQFWGI